MAAIAVSVRRGSMTMISGLCGFRVTRSQRTGWAMQGFGADQDDAVRTLRGPDKCKAGRRIRTPACRPRRPMAMHWPRVAVAVRRSPCRTSRLRPVGPSPRSRSVPCSGRRPRRRRARPGSRGTGAVIVAIASCQSTGRRRPSSPRSSGTVARSGASSTVRASHPLGQAMPRFTG